MSEFNYNEINKRAIAPNILKSYGIDIEKGGEGSGRKKVKINSWYGKHKHMNGKEYDVDKEEKQPGGDTYYHITDQHGKKHKISKFYTDEVKKSIAGNTPGKETAMTTEEMEKGGVGSGRKRGDQIHYEKDGKKWSGTIDSTLPSGRHTVIPHGQNKIQHTVHENEIVRTAGEQGHKEDTKEAHEKRGFNEAAGDEDVTGKNEKLDKATTGGQEGRDDQSLKNNENIFASDTMKVNTQEMIDEHQKLINTLESESHEDDKEEAKKQKKELKEYKEEVKKAYDILGVDLIEKGGPGSGRHEGSLKDEYAHHSAHAAYHSQSKHGSKELREKHLDAMDKISDKLGEQDKKEAQDKAGSLKPDLDKKVDKFVHYKGK